jgi:glycogen operon protein
MHAGRYLQQFTLPLLRNRVRWRQFIDTQPASPYDIYPDLDGPAPPANGKVQLVHHSLMCFVSTDSST